MTEEQMRMIYGNVDAVWAGILFEQLGLPSDLGTILTAVDRDELTADGLREDCLMIYDDDRGRHGVVAEDADGGWKVLTGMAALDWTWDHGYAGWDISAIG